jgi:hypothetical protein
MIDLEKPQESKVELYAVDGDKLCEWVAKKINSVRGWDLSKIDVYDYILNQRYGYDSNEIDIFQDLFELIIEEEDYCNGDNQNDIQEVVLMTIAEEFGGHFNINFLSMTAYM